MHESLRAEELALGAEFEALERFILSNSDEVTTEELSQWFDQLDQWLIKVSPNESLRDKLKDRPKNLVIRVEALLDQMQETMAAANTGDQPNYLENKIIPNLDGLRERLDALKKYSMSD